MNPGPPADMAPRKNPRQTRSAVTVDVIFEATLQVLRKTGRSELTTTRVADRAGVSVGTLYQYFPHKNALLFGALQRHMGTLAIAMEGVCQHSQGRRLDVMAEALVNGYIDMKLARAQDRRAFHDVVVDLGMAQTQAHIAQQMDTAVGQLLLSAPGAEFRHPGLAAASLMDGMRAVTRAAMLRPQQPGSLDALRDELTVYAQRHLGTLSHAPRRVFA